jgi:CheY-like chemotaxis protein
MTMMASILIVDDALIMRKTLRTYFENAGYHVVDEAANGEQAVAAYKKYLPDLVTMDITMPGMDGIEALKQIRQDDPHAKVIMVSALGQQHKIFDSLQNGAKHYVLKPLDRNKLLSVVEQVLSA